MKGIIASLAALAALTFGVAFAQVTTAEVLGVAETRAHSSGSSALYQDGSVGEVLVRVRALDAGGNPVPGASVSWVLTNRTTAPAYLVGASAEGRYPVLLVGSGDTELDGGVTDANGEAYLVLDARSAGDVVVKVTIEGMEAKGYDGSDMRVVWF